jgi:hypothetical protein
LTLNEKSRLIIVEQSGKSDKMLITLKNDLFGCFKIEKIRDKGNETGLKERGGVTIETTVLPFAMLAPSLL